MSPGDEMAGSAHKLGEGLRSPGNFQRPNPQPKLAEGMHEVFIGIGRHLNNATAALETIHGQLLAIEQQTKRRSPGGFARYLLAMFIGVADLLAWQSYSEAAMQIIATKAPELGWSPGARQMIAGWVQQLGWSKIPPVAENTAQPFVPGTQQLASAVQTAPENVTPKAPVAPSIDPEQVHQIASDVAAQRQTIELIAAGQDQMAHEVDRLQGAVAEMLVKMPEPPPPRPVAAAVPARPVAAAVPARPVAAAVPARPVAAAVPAPPVAAAVPAPKPNPKSMAPPWSRGPMPRYGSPYGPPYQ
jgi:hypothetical protein